MYKTVEINLNARNQFFNKNASCFLEREKEFLHEVDVKDHKVVNDIEKLDKIADFLHKHLSSSVCGLDNNRELDGGGREHGLELGKQIGKRIGWNIVFGAIKECPIEHLAL